MTFKTSRLDPGELLSKTAHQIDGYCSRVATKKDKLNSHTQDIKTRRPSEVEWQYLWVITDGCHSTRFRAIFTSHLINETTRDVVFETTRKSSSTAAGDDNIIEVQNSSRAEDLRSLWGVEV